MSDGAATRFFGGLLIAVGALVVTLSGLCSLGFVAMTLGQALKGPALLSNFVRVTFMVGIVGGLPFLVGVALIIAGRAALRGV